jgi:hypothetical protein
MKLVAGQVRCMWQQQACSRLVTLLKVSAGSFTFCWDGRLCV